MLNQQANQQANQWVVGGLGCVEKPEGPADKLFRALGAFDMAVKAARAAGWDVTIALEDGEIHVSAGKRLIVSR